MPDSLTTVISVRGLNRDVLLADPNFVYVGRPVFRGPTNWKGSIWANPFKVGIKRQSAIRILGRDIDHCRRDETVNARLCLQFYWVWLREVSGLMPRLGELRSRVLGCWCCSWNPGEPVVTHCHAIVLAQAADRLLDSTEAKQSHA